MGTAIQLRSTPAEADCERVLRSLPMWFGIEDALQAYVADTSRLPTLLLRQGDTVIGFATLAPHFAASCELHCMALLAQHRGQGHGRALMDAVEAWSRAAGHRFLQVKTVADTSTSVAYAQTRAFYAAMGFAPLEVFPTLWGPRNPCLQLIKHLG